MRRQARGHESRRALPDAEIVAGVLSRGGKICLLKRSASVRCDAGCWHCITGHLPPAQRPVRQILAEIAEEAGLPSDGLVLKSRAVFDRPGGDGRLYRIHAFHFACCTAEVRLNWEHESVRWVSPHEARRLRTVYWLQEVLDRLGLKEAPASEPCTVESIYFAGSV